MDHIFKQLTPDDLIGTIRRFGLWGPIYEVLEKIDTLDNGDAVMKIILPESGEETQYRFSSMIEDPQEYPL